MTDNSTSPLTSLLGIAPELRNQTYDYLAADPGVIAVHRRSVVPHALARVCRQIRREFLPVFQASKFEQGTMISARVKNFRLYELGDAIPRILVSRKVKNAEDCKLLEVVVDDIKEVKKHGEVGVWSWQCSRWRGGTKTLSDLDCEFSVRIADRSRTKHGLKLPTKLLVKLRTDLECNQPSIHPTRSLKRLKARSIKELQRMSCGDRQLLLESSEGPRKA